MLYLDYNWDVTSDRIVLDEELNTVQLGWDEGDIFKFTDIDGKRQLVKVDPIEKFVRGYK